MNNSTISTFIIILGIIFYFLAMGLLYAYSPSGTACLKKNNSGLLLLCASTCLLFLSVYLSILRETNKPIIFLLFILITLLTASSGAYLYNKCFQINNLITQNVDYSIKIIKSKYSSLVNIKPLANCVNYHSGQYFSSKDIVCRSITDCPGSAGIVCDQKKGAKLVDFYISSSHQTCHIPISSGNYVSTEMIKVVLSAGARMLDFNVYAQPTNTGIKPVVKSNINNTISLNYVTLQDVFETISTYAFLLPNNDPLLIHLNLKTNNIGVIDNIANLYIDYFGPYLLEPRFSYLSSESMAIKPICNYINKIILIVSGETSHTYLDELVNLHTSYNARILSAKTVQKPVEPDDFAFSNQNIFTIMKPYDYKNNTNPSSAFTYGVQAPLMNFWSLNKLMKNYIDFFSKSSFVMKSFELQQDRLPPKLITAAKKFNNTVVEISDNNVQTSSPSTVQEKIEVPEPLAAARAEAAREEEKAAKIDDTTGYYSESR